MFLVIVDLPWWVDQVSSRVPFPDDHVAIGGKYFDLHDTEFRLTPITENKTELTIHASYRINSAINFYAVPASRFLGGDFMRTILGLYKHRSEQSSV